MERQTLDTIAELQERESQKSGSQSAQPILGGSNASSLDKLVAQGHSTDRLDTLQEDRRGSTDASESEGESGQPAGLLSPAAPLLSLDPAVGLGADVGQGARPMPPPIRPNPSIITPTSNRSAAPERPQDSLSFMRPASQALSRQTSASSKGSAPPGSPHPTVAQTLPSPALPLSSPPQPSLAPMPLPEHLPTAPSGAPLQVWLSPPPPASTFTSSALAEAEQSTSPAAHRLAATSLEHSKSRRMSGSACKAEAPAATQSKAPPSSKIIHPGMAGGGQGLHLPLPPAAPVQGPTGGTWTQHQPLPTVASQQPPPPEHQQQQQQQQGMVPFSVLHALLQHPAFASLPPPDLSNIWAAVAGMNNTPPPPISQAMTSSQQQQQQQQQQPQFSQQYYAQQAWVAQQQAQQAQSAPQASGISLHLPPHLHNLVAHHNERAAQVMQQPNTSPGSAVASYMDQLSEAGDDTGVLPVGEPLLAQVDPSSYAPSEMFESTSLERDNSPLEHPCVGDLTGTGPTGGRGFQGKADNVHHTAAGSHGAKQSMVASHAANMLVNRAGQMARPPTLNDLHQAPHGLALDGRDGEYEATPSESRASVPVCSHADEVRAGRQVPQDNASQGTSVAPSQAGGGGQAPPMSVAALFGNMAAEQMAFLKKAGSSASGGVPPDEDEILRRRKAAARAREKIRKQERMRAQGRLSTASGMMSPTQAGTSVRPSRMATSHVVGDQEPFNGPSRYQVLSQLPSRRMSYAAQSARFKSQFGQGMAQDGGDEETAGTKTQSPANLSSQGPSVMPSLPMSKMASQDVSMLLAQNKGDKAAAAGHTAFMDKDAVSALTQALQSGTPPQRSSVQQGALGHMDSQPQQPAYSKATSRHYSRNDGGSEAQAPLQQDQPSAGGESLGQQFAIKINKQGGRVGEMQMANDGPGWLNQAAQSTSSSSSEESVPVAAVDARFEADPLLKEGEPLLDENGEPITEEEAKRLRDEALKQPGAAQEQLEGIGLFANPDDDDEEAKKHDLQKALERRSKYWYQDTYWQIFLITNSCALLLMIIGIVLQEKVRHVEGVDTEAFRWFYFFCFWPPFWFAVDISIHYIFYILEWRFFANSLLYLKNLVGKTVSFVYLTLLLLWHAVVFDWAWCHEDARCEGDAYIRATGILWRVHVCCVLFALANLFKAFFAKLLSTHFYKTAHFKKLETALEKEYFLQLLSQPQRKALARRHAEEQMERTKKEAKMQRDIKHQVHLDKMHRVVDKVKDFKHKIVDQHDSFTNAEGRNIFKRKSQPDVQPGSTQVDLQQQQQQQQQQQGSKHSWAKSHFLMSHSKAGDGRSASADTTATAKAVTQEGALPLTMESIKLLQSMNHKLPAEFPSAGQPFPEGAEHVAGGGADGELFVQPPAGSPTNVVLSQQQLQQQQQQQQQLQQQESGMQHSCTSAPSNVDGHAGGLNGGTSGGNAAAANTPGGLQALDEVHGGAAASQPPRMRYLLPTHPAQPQTHFWSGEDCPPSTVSKSPNPGGAQPPPPPPPPPPPAPPMPPPPPNPSTAAALPGGSPGQAGNQGGGAGLQPSSSRRSTGLLEQQAQQQQQSAGSPHITSAADISVEVKPDEGVPNRRQSWGPDMGITEGLPEHVYAGHGCNNNPAYTMDDGQDGPGGPHFQRNSSLMDPKPLPVINEFLHSESQDMQGKGTGANSVPMNRPSYLLGREDSGSGGKQEPRTAHTSRANLSQTLRQTEIVGGVPPLERASNRDRRQRATPLDEAILQNMAPLPGKLKEEPAKLKQKKDLAQLTEDELEKMRTAVVVKTYTSIIRNYNSMTTEEQEQEMARVRAFSRALFYNIKGDEDREYVSVEDFEMFFNDKKTAAKAFAVFDVDGDNHVTRREIKEGVVGIYKERANMAASLKDTDSIVQSLETCIGGVIHFIFVAFYLLIWNVSLVEGFSTFSATLLAFTFIFGNAVRNMFESMLFLFVEHAYDVGDNILMNGEIYRIKKITLLYTEMITLSGERIFYPNTGLTNAVIRNWTRSQTFTEFIYFDVDVGVTPWVLQDTMASMLEHAKAHPTEYDDVPFLQFFGLANPMKVTILLTFTYAFQPDDWLRLVPARNAMFGIVQAKFAEHKLRCTVHYIERRTIHTSQEPLPTEGQPIY